MIRCRAQHACGIGAAARSGWRLGVIALTLATAPYASADDRPAGEPGGRSPADQPTADAAAAPDSQDAHSGAVLPKRSEASTARGRGVNRAGAVDPSRLSADDRSAPWYRSAIGSLAIVLTLVGGAYWAAKRWLPAARAAENGALAIVARTAITPKQSVALVQMGRRFVLVGVSADRVTTLSEITDPDEVAELAIKTGTTPERPRSGFDGVLDGQSSSYRDVHRKSRDELLAGRRESPTAEAAEPLVNLLERLRSLKTK